MHGRGLERVATGRHGLEDILSESWMNDRKSNGSWDLQRTAHTACPMTDRHDKWKNRALKQHDAALAVSDSDATGCQAMIARFFKECSQSASRRRFG